MPFGYGRATVPTDSLQLCQPGQNLDSAGSIRTSSWDREGLWRSNPSPKDCQPPSAVSGGWEKGCHSLQWWTLRLVACATLPHPVLMQRGPDWPQWVSHTQKHGSGKGTWWKNGFSWRRQKGRGRGWQRFLMTLFHYTGVKLSNSNFIISFIFWDHNYIFPLPFPPSKRPVYHIPPCSPSKEKKKQIIMASYIWCDKKMERSVDLKFISNVCKVVLLTIPDANHPCRQQTLPKPRILGCPQ